MNRYFSSFALTSAIYCTTLGVAIYFLSSESCDASSKIERTKVVKISLLNLHKEAKQELHEEKPLQTPKPIQEIKKEPLHKEEPKKSVKKLFIPLEVKQSDKHLSDAKSMEKIASQEEIKQEEFVKQDTAEEKSSPKVHSNEERMERNMIAQEELQERQRDFFIKLRELINQNKSYPNSARRRGIQGDIQVKFCILEDGNVQSIELISGHAIFETSALEAIQKSFPINVDKTLFGFPKEFQITLAYILK